MRKTIAFVFALIFLVLIADSSAQGPAIDWKKEQTEILQHYRALVQINSVYGNETRVAEYLKKILDTEGIPSKTFALDPNRANLVARLKGNGSKRPLLILAHTDVVAVQTEKWPVDPFGAVMKDVYFGASEQSTIKISWSRFPRCRRVLRIWHSFARKESSPMASVQR